MESVAEIGQRVLFGQKHSARYRQRAHGKWVGSGEEPNSERSEQASLAVCYTGFKTVAR